MLCLGVGADAVYQLKCCLAGTLEQLESVLGAADSDSTQVGLWSPAIPFLFADSGKQADDVAIVTYMAGVIL